jgi:hypothetical protein
MPAPRTSTASTRQKAIWLSPANAFAIRVSGSRSAMRGLSADPERYDAVASALVLNFIPDLPAALGEMVRVARRGGVIAAYVWDYAGQMKLMRYFWDAVIALFPEDAERDEGRRFPVARRRL